jgi:hypothetical protein
VVIFYKKRVGIIDCSCYAPQALQKNTLQYFGRSDMIQKMFTFNLGISLNMSKKLSAEPIKFFRGYKVAYLVSLYGVEKAVH